MSNEKYIKTSASSHFSIRGVEVWVKDPLPNGINLRKIVEKLLNSVPHHLMTNLDIIYVGNFKELRDRKIQAMYTDSSIFATNDHDSEMGMLDDLIHEVAHSVEEQFGELIYSDGKIEREFLNKRRAMWSILKDEGYDVELKTFLKSDFDSDFDMFLYNGVGYPHLSLYLVNLFCSPYGSTSLSEYFANGFEAFFMREDLPRIKSISPELFKKINKLLDIKEKT